MVIPITIVAYLVMMIVIGVIFSKKNNNVSDFYLGGRKLGPFVTAMSAEASDMSSWLLMGLPGVAYLSGCAEAGWTARYSVWYPLHGQALAQHSVPLCWQHFSGSVPTNRVL